MHCTCIVLLCQVESFIFYDVTCDRFTPLMIAKDYFFVVDWNQWKILQSNLLLNYLATSRLSTRAPPVHFANFRSLNNGNYNVSWMYDTATDRLHFMTEVMTTGWVGFGFATRAPTGMIGYDVAVGGVVDGTGYLRVMLFCLICIQPVPVSQRVGKVKRSGGQPAGSRKEKVLESYSSSFWFCLCCFCCYCSDQNIKTQPLPPTPLIVLFLWLTNLFTVLLFLITEAFNKQWARDLKSTRSPFSNPKNKILMSSYLLRMSVKALLHLIKNSTW